MRLTAIRKHSLPITVLPKALLSSQRKNTGLPGARSCAKKKKRLLPGASPLYARLLMEDVRGQAAGKSLCCGTQNRRPAGDKFCLPGLDAATGKAPMAGLTAAMEACLHAERGP